MATPAIKSMSIGDLLSLRTQIDQLLQSRKSELHAQLRQIEGDSAPARRGRPPGSGRGGHSLKGRKVAPLYRHPKSGETWSGRGGMARWLAAEIKAGKKKEDFLIGTPKAAKAAKKAKD